MTTHKARTAAEVADELRVSPRQFRDLVKQAEAVAGPIGIPAGRRRIVYDDGDVEQLKRALRCSRSSSAVASGTCAGPSEASASTRLRELLTPTGPKNP